MTSSMKAQLRLRIIVTDPLANVTFAVQRGRTELLAPCTVSARALTFEFTVSIAATSPIVRLTGEFTQGPPAKRFVYVNSGTYALQTGSCWSRRAKVPLAGVTAALIESALRKERALEARIAGAGRDGGPACASVPLLSGWSEAA